MTKQTSKNNDQAERIVKTFADMPDEVLYGIGAVFVGLHIIKKLFKQAEEKK